MRETDYVRCRNPMPGVASITGYRSDNLPVGVHRGVPSPHLTLVFSLDEPIISSWREADLGAPTALRRHVIVAGLHDRPAFIRQPGYQEGIQLAVHPLAARRYLGVPAAQIAGDREGDAAVLGRPASGIIDRVGSLPSWDTRFAAVRQLLGRLAEANPGAGRPRAEVVEAWRWLVRTGGRAAVGDLARHVLLSPRQLRTELVRELGFGPKALARLIRFHRVVAEMSAATRNGQPPRLAALAAGCGYADQAHLSREFAGFVGLSPSEWMLQERRNLQAGGHRNG